MERIIDLTGPMYTGMWNYEPPFPTLDVQPLPSVDWVESKLYCEIFSGLHSQSGTYLETPAHLLGYEKSYYLSEVPLAKLVDIPTVVLKPSGLIPDETGRAPITGDMLRTCQKEIAPGCAVLVCTGWGKKWRDADYLSASPYFTADAMDFLIQKHPFILGSDLPRWENLSKPQNFFPKFYDANILMAGPFVNLEQIASPAPRLTLLPLNIEKTCCAPVRAFVRDTDD